MWPPSNRPQTAPAGLRTRQGSLRFTVAAVMCRRKGLLWLIPQGGPGWLQYGRGHVTAESVHTRPTNRVMDWLQCGRGHVTAERANVWTQCPMTWQLQCGRGRVTAESLAGGITLVLQGVASMWPRSCDRGKNEA